MNEYIGLNVRNNERERSREKFTNNYMDFW